MEQKNDVLKRDLHGDNVQYKDGLTPDLMGPWDPYFLKPPARSNLDRESHLELVIEWVNKKRVLLRTYGATAIMFPDITPKVVNAKFHVALKALLPIMEKDSPRQFLRFFEKYGGYLVWRDLIIPEALDCLVTLNAVKCAKLVLEGTAPELQGLRANPNWMTQYGHFPLHQAAEVFHIDMIKLLISKGASANVRTAGDRIINGLLPLHVAVENTCLHKYLEDNQFPKQERWSYSKADVYKLILLLCMPEMKLFLDTTRELAKHTNNLIDEVWNYIKDGKLVHAGVLLLAAQEQIRLGPSFKNDANGNPDGFATIVNRIANRFCTFAVNSDSKEKELEQPPASIKYLSSALLLVNAISRTGKTLHEYIQVHSEVPHADVVERVSSILKDSGFYPPEEGTDIGKLCPYQCQEYEEYLLDNPNCLYQYGQFPLHQAAETFSLDMVKLLLRKGVSANVRMAGEVEAPLPLHVAVENTCLHKYLEDNLLPNQQHPSYSKADVYKLIHILCLPEMKIYLDTTRELAKHTNDLVDEVWHYIKAGKLVHAGVVLLAAQELIGFGFSSKKNGNSKQDGFAILVNRITDHFYAFDLEMGQHGMELEHPHANINYLSSALLLVNAISQVGEALQEHIQLHSEVPHVDALERVSSILKDSGFYPAEEGFDIENLCKYKWLPNRELLDKYGCMVATKNGTKTSCLHAFTEKALMKKVIPKKWEIGYKLALFFPYSRSVLVSNFHVKLFPSRASGEIFSMDFHRLRGSKFMDKKSATTSSDNFPLFKEIQRHVSQPRRSLTTAATATLLKVLKKA